MHGTQHRKEAFKVTYCNTDATTGQSKLHVDTEAERLSRNKILSHQAGIRFFSPESYPEHINISYMILQLTNPCNIKGEDRICF